MSDNSKLLFWTDSALLHYCLAFAIQQKTNHEIFGLFDVPNRLKSFFNKQKFVNYKKLWFFHDNISKLNNPDLNYLKKCEGRYDLNLGSASSSDPHQLIQTVRYRQTSGHPFEFYFAKFIITSKLENM